MNIKNHRRYFLFILFAATIMASCKVTKDYQRQDLNIAAQYRGVSYGDTASIADIPWKTFFTEPALQALIEKGIAHNTDILVAIKNIEIADQQLKQAKLSWTPGVSLQAQGQYNRPSGNSFNGAFLPLANEGKNFYNDFQLGPNISWEAGIWGKISRQKEAALDQYLQTDEARKAVQTTVVSNIAKGFYNLLMLDKQLAVAKSNLLLSDSTLRLTKLLKDAGEATQLSVDQTQAQRESVAVLIPQIEQSIELEENALQLLTGDYPAEIARSVQLTDIIVPASLPVGLPASIVSRRPDVRSAELSVMEANANVGVAAANMYPSFTISANAGLDAMKIGKLFDAGSWFTIATAGLTQPIFNQRQLRTKYEVAKLQRDQSAAQFRQSVLSAVGEVSNALVQIDKLKQQEQITSAQATALHQAIANSLLLYKSDMANYLEVITAQTNALQADLSLASIRSNTLMAVVELYRSSGGGWK